MIGGSSNGRTTGSELVYLGSNPSSPAKKFMNTTQVDDFFEKHKKGILELFKLYQMLETLLFMKLYFPKIGKTESLKSISKKLNKKTFGKLAKEYIKQNPNDVLKIKKLFRVVGSDRNSFMHNMWINLALLSKSDFDKYSEKILEDYTQNAKSLFKIVTKV